MEADVEEHEEDVGIHCASCLEPLEFVDDDVVMAQVVQIHAGANGRLEDVSVYMTEDKEPVYTPLFHCFSCFENMQEAVNTLTADKPPITYPEEELIECDFCGGSILDTELCVQFDHGELVVSQKTGLPKFIDALRATPLFMCLPCATQITGRLEDEEEDEDGMAELWPDLSGDDECAHCTVLQCWRLDSCNCACHSCHEDE